MGGASIAHCNMAINRAGGPVIAVEADVIGLQHPGFGIFTIAHHELIGGGIELQHEKGLRCLNADTATLADRVVHQAFVVADNLTFAGDDLAGNGDIRPVLGDEIGVGPIAHKADLLALRLDGHWQAKSAGQR